MNADEKKKLYVFLCISTLVSLVISGLEVTYTAYAINNLKVDATEWSQVRSVRYLLTMIAVFLFGTYASRIGSKKLAIFTVILSILSLMFTVWYPNKLMLFLMYPLYSALSQILLVNLNVWAQESSDRVRALTNTLYRSSFIAFSMLGPILSAYWMTGGYMDAFLFFSVLLALCLAVLTLFPVKRTVYQSAKSGISDMVKELRQWRKIFQNSSVIYYLILTGLINQAFLINLVLLPIKLMTGIGFTEQQYSISISVYSLVGFVFILSTGFLLNRYLNSMIFVPFFLCSLGNLLMGITSNAVLIVVVFVISNALFQLTMAPTSLWLSRMFTGNDLSVAFSLAKITSSLLGALATTILALMQPIIGINYSLVIYGMVGMVISCLLLLVLRNQAQQTTI